MCNIANIEILIKIQNKNYVSKIYISHLHLYRPILILESPPVCLLLLEDEAVPSGQHFHCFGERGGATLGHGVINQQGFFVLSPINNLHGFSCGLWQDCCGLLWFLFTKQNCLEELKRTLHWQKHSFSPSWRVIWWVPSFRMRFAIWVVIQTWHAKSTRKHVKQAATEQIPTISTIPWGLSVKPFAS